LRLHDNAALLAALSAAASSGGRVACVFAWSEAEQGTAGPACPRPGAASRVWLHAALASLDADLRRRFATPLLLAAAPHGAALRQLGAALGASRVHAAARYEPALADADAATAAELEAHGMRLELHHGYLLHAPGDIALDLTDFSGHFGAHASRLCISYVQEPPAHDAADGAGTMLPFQRACARRPPPALPLPEPSGAAAKRFLPASAPPPPGCVSLDALQLARMPRRPDGSVVDWGAALLRAWGGAACISEADALSRCDAYCTAELLADGAAASRLSPYLRFGQLSPRRLAAAAAAASGGASTPAARSFTRRLVWRDLAYWQLSRFPAVTHAPLRWSLDAQSWAQPPQREQRLAAWRRGATGFPLVDAAMRELFATGWMQQRFRMVAASFLVRSLRVPWQDGLAWFHDTLVDADVAINSMMWANCAGAGLDPWSFEDTLLQTPQGSARPSDPTAGDYIRKWLPELAALPAQHLHAPWAAPPAVLAAAGVVLGESGTYPARIVDAAAEAAAHDADARAARLAASPGWRDAAGYDLLEVPPGCVAAPHPAAGGGLVRLFTLPEQRRAGIAAPATPPSRDATPAKRRKAPSSRAAATQPPKTAKRPRRISLADAPVVGRNARRDRDERALRRYTDASVADVDALEAASEDAA
jgi:deoxyribodipyrimidine photolyase